MRCTRIVTAFVKDGERLLILRRSRSVKTMKGLWAGISGIIEGDEAPIHRARVEIYEEAGIPSNEITLVSEAEKMRVHSPQYKNHEWEIFPFLFRAENPTVRLNWENSEYRWIRPDELYRYDTVPSLNRVLSRLL